MRNHSPEFEQSLLGCCMLDEAAAVDILDIPEAHFYRSEHVVIFRKIKELYQKQAQFDSLSVMDALERDGSLARAGGPEYVTEVAELGSVHVPGRTQGYKKTLAEYYQVRELMRLSTDLFTQMENGAAPADSIAFMQDAMGELMATQQQGGLIPFNDGIDDAIQFIDERFHNPGILSGQSTGYPAIDAAFDGLQDGKLYFIGARPKIGKSSWVFSWLWNLTIGPRPWLVFSLEMTMRGLAMRGIAYHSGIFNDKLRTGSLAEEDFPKLTKGINLMKDLNLHIDERPSLSMAQIRAAIKAFVIRHGAIGGIVVDHIGLLAQGNPNDRTGSTTENVNDLLRLAKEYSCPVIPVVQLNRSLEMRTDKRPRPSDTKQSGAIEENADGLILLYRDEIYNEDTPWPGIMEVNIAISRDSEPRVIPYKADLATGRFVELTEMPGDPDDTKAF